MINRCTPNPEFYWPNGTFWCFRQPTDFAERTSLETSEAKQYEPAFAPQQARAVLQAADACFNGPRVLSEPPG